MPSLLVADACSLILLAKARALEPLARSATVALPTSVEGEVCAPPLVRRHSDAAQIAALVASGTLDVREVRSHRELPSGLGRGERDALLLFLQEEADRLLTDDARAMRACRLLGVPFVAAPRVVTDLHAGGLLERREARLGLERLAVVGRYAPDIIAAAFERLTHGEEP